LKYLTAECNYGGRVTDDKDRRLITCLLDFYYNKDALTDENYKFANDDCYKIPNVEKHEEFIEFI